MEAGMIFDARTVARILGGDAINPNQSGRTGRIRTD
jgi:hypothetical protein